MPGEQHCVPEYVAPHVADSDDREVGALRIDAKLAEVALDRLPPSARGDPHPLVVIALGAAGGERVAEPEAVLVRERVGDVGERRGPLVGRDHQIGIVSIVAHHAGRRDHLPPGQVVGHVEQAADQDAVAGDAFRLDRFAAGVRRHLLGNEASLRADRHDHRVLHHLRLRKPQHLGAKVLAPVRPADAPARNGAATQVHALHPRRVDGDLVLRPRLGELRDLVRIELERDVRFR